MQFDDDEQKITSNKIKKQGKSKIWKGKKVMLLQNSKFLVSIIFFIIIIFAWL